MSFVLCVSICQAWESIPSAKSTLCLFGTVAPEKESTWCCGRPDVVNCCSHAASPHHKAKVSELHDAPTDCQRMRHDALSSPTLPPPGWWWSPFANTKLSSKVSNQGQGPLQGRTEMTKGPTLGAVRPAFLMAIVEHVCMPVFEQSTGPWLCSPGQLQRQSLCGCAAGLAASEATVHVCQDLRSHSNVRHCAGLYLSCPQVLAVICWAATMFNSCCMCALQPVAPSAA